ncbi:glycosyltransferase [soil metagenome]
MEHEIRYLNALGLQMLRDLPPLESGCAAIVILPVRNEEALLGETLRALRDQLSDAGHPLDSTRYEVLTLVNNSCDASAAIARDFANAHPHFRLHVQEEELPEPLAHVGAARRILMDLACRRFRSLHRSDGLIASTDADTVPAPDWISAMLRAVEDGADAVGGRILFRLEELRALPQSIRVPYLQDVSYRYLAAELAARLDPRPEDPWPHHFQNFGASMAVTAAAYAQVGGLPVRSSLEDVALFDALERFDARIRRPIDVRVHTSPRLDGKTSFGLAVQLCQWRAGVEAGDCVLVPPAQAIVRHAMARKMLRGIWKSHQDTSPHDAARLLGLDASTLWEAIGTSNYLGELWQKIGGPTNAAGCPPEYHVPITVAIGQLRAMLSSLRPGERPVFKAREEIQPVAGIQRSPSMLQPPG